MINKKITEKLINPYCFTDRALQVEIKTTLGSHHYNHINFKLSIKSNYSETGSETKFNKQLLKGMATIYARLINIYIFKMQTEFSASFYKQDEDGMVLDEYELFNNLKINQNIAQSDFDNFILRFQSEQQIQKQERKDSEWRFDKSDSMTSYFSKNY